MCGFLHIGIAKIFDGEETIAHRLIAQVEMQRGEGCLFCGVGGPGRLRGAWHGGVGLCVTEGRGGGRAEMVGQAE